MAARCAHLTVPKSLHRPRDKHAERRLRGKNGTGRGEHLPCWFTAVVFVPLGGGSAVRQSGAML